MYSQNEVELENGAYKIQSATHYYAIFVLLHDVFVYLKVMANQTLQWKREMKFHQRKRDCTWIKPFLKPVSDTDKV